MKLAALFALAACGRIDFDVSPAPPAPAFVQSPAVMAQTGAQLVVPVSAGAGHLLVVAVDFGNPSTTVTSIDDVGGNVYASADARAGGSAIGFATELWYAAATRAFSGDMTITLDSSASAFVWVAEFAGMATSSPLAATSTLDDGAPDQGTTAASAITTTDANELVFVVNANNGGVAAVAAPFTALEIFTGDDSAYALLPEPGTYSAVWDVVSGNMLSAFCTSVAAFYAAR